MGFERVCREPPRDCRRANSSHGWGSGKCHLLRARAALLRGVLEPEGPDHPSDGERHERLKGSRSRDWLGVVDKCRTPGSVTVDAVGLCSERHGALSRALRLYAWVGRSGPRPLRWFRLQRLLRISLPPRISHPSRPDSSDLLPGEPRAVHSHFSLASLPALHFPVHSFGCRW